MALIEENNRKPIIKKSIIPNEILDITVIDMQAFIEATNEDLRIINTRPSVEISTETNNSFIPFLPDLNVFDAIDAQAAGIETTYVN